MRYPLVKMFLLHAVKYCILAALGSLFILGGARSAMAATPCNGTVPAGPTVKYTQIISNTNQSGQNLFVCRVDGVGALASTSRIGTRNVTASGFFLLVMARWLHFIGYALGFGTLAFGMIALGVSSVSMRRVWRLVSIGIVLMLCAEPLALLAQTIGMGQTVFDLAIAGDVLASGFGLVWAQRVGVALLLWVVCGVVKDGRAGAVWAVPMLGLVLAVIDGSAGATGVRTPRLMIAAATLHEIAMGAWIGGLVLLLTLWNNLERERRVVIVSRFGWLSAAAISILSVTGVVMVAARMTQPAETFTTLYGVLFVVKLLVAFVAIGFTVFGQPLRMAWRWRTTLITLIAVLGVASLLVSVPSS